MVEVLIDALRSRSPAVTLRHAALACHVVLGHDTPPLQLAPALRRPPLCRAH
jgi:hypothetical protein